MKSAVTICLPVLLALLASCTSSGPTWVSDNVTVPAAPVDAPLSEVEARRLFLAEERERRGVRIPVDPPRTRIDRRARPEPVAEESPGRITHAEAYRRSRRLPGPSTSGEHSVRAVVDPSEPGGDASPRPAFTQAIEGRGSAIPVEPPHFLRASAERGRVAATRRGVAIPAPTESNGGPGLTARPTMRLEPAPAHEPQIN